LYSYTTKELLDKILNFEGKTMLFVDTETTGLEPNVSYEQITEISALAIDGSTMEPAGEFSTKVNLTWRTKNLLNDPQSKQALAFDRANQRFLRKYKKPITHPRELLQKTHYFDTKPGEKKMEENDALINLSEFIKKYPNPILIAHNATFDMKTLQARRKKYNLPPMERYPVLDTVKVSRFFFIPLLLSLEGNQEAKEFLESILAKTKFKSYSSSLGKLASAFKIKIEGWHQASEDVKMLFQVLQKLIEYLKANKDVDIRKQQGIQAKRWRRMK